MDKKKIKQTFCTPSNNRFYLLISSSVFALIALAHLIMILMQAPAVIGGYEVPPEFNAVIVVLLGALATRGFCAACRMYCK